MPKTIDETKAVVNKYAGREIRLEHGLSGQCRPDKVRYIRILLDGVEQDMLDPAGTKGCGARYYTKDFKDAESNTYITEIACDCGTPTPEQAAAGQQPVTVVLRGFESVEKILPPLAS